jgi:hypothetical protein
MLKPPAASKGTVGQPGEHTHHHAQQPGHGAGPAKIVEVEGHAVQVDGRCHARLIRPALAAGQDERLFKELQPADHAERDTEVDHRLQARQGDVQELLPAAGAVHRGGFVQVFGDGLQRGQVEHGVEAHEAPEHDEGNRRLDGFGFAQPIDGCDAGQRTQGVH